MEDEALAAQIAAHDLVLDCTDNVAIRNQLNAGCFRHKTPLVSGAAIRMEGQISVFTYQEDEPCYRCLSRLFGENALTCVDMYDAMRCQFREMRLPRNPHCEVCGTP